MKELGLKQETAVLHGDNQSAIAAAKNGVRTERSKHIDIRHSFITDVLESGAMTIEWVATQQQQADIFTKALHAPQHETLRVRIMSA